MYLSTDLAPRPFMFLKHVMYLSQSSNSTPIYITHPPTLLSPGSFSSVLWWVFWLGHWWSTILTLYWFAKTGRWMSLLPRAHLTFDGRRISCLTSSTINWPQPSSQLYYCQLHSVSREQTVIRLWLTTNILVIWKGRETSWHVWCMQLTLVFFLCSDS